MARLAAVLNCSFVFNSPFALHAAAFSNHCKQINSATWVQCEQRKLVHVTDQSVTFRWKNRAKDNRREISTIAGVEFVARYLRHVLPRGLRSIRYYGFCHPAAKANRLRVQFHTGLASEFGAAPEPAHVRSGVPLCAGCGKPMRLVRRLIAPGQQRAPPSADASTSLQPANPIHA